MSQDPLFVTAGIEALIGDNHPCTSATIRIPARAPALGDNSRYAQVFPATVGPGAAERGRSAARSREAEPGPTVGSFVDLLLDHAGVYPACADAASSSLAF